MMSGIEWLVVLLGIGAVILVNWYFFFAERSGNRTGGARRDSEVKQ
jgi:hypothetical protein